MQPNPSPRRYVAIIKIDRGDTYGRQAKAIEEGIYYACALLMDTYGLSADAIADLADRIRDDAYDRESERAN